MSARAFGIAAVAIVVVAAALRFDALGVGLPNQRTRPDEQPVVLEMARPARGDFALEMLVYPNAYVYATWLWVEAGLAIGPVLGFDVPGGFQKTLIRAPEQIYRIGRAMSATAGALAVLLVIGMARREWGAEAALAAGLLLATCSLHARDSHALKPDALLSLTVLLALAGAVRLAERPSPGNILVAGTGLGLAMATKYTGILMLVPLYVAGWMAGDRTGWRRLFPAPAIGAGVVAAAVFALTSPHLVFQGPLLDWSRAILGVVLPDLLPMPEDSLLRPIDPALLATIPPGVDLESYGNRPWYHGIVFHTTFSLWYGIGALATLLAPFAVAWGLVGRKPLPVLAAVACAVQFIVMALTPAVTARYLTQMLPILLLLEAGLLAGLVQRLPLAWRRWTLGALVILVAAQPLLATLGHNRIASETDTRVLATEWLASNVGPHANLAFAGNVLMPYGQPEPPKGANVVARDLDEEKLIAAGTDYLITHEHSLYFSTLDEAALAKLGPRLSLLAEFDPAASPDAPTAVFEQTDAYYIPVHGFDRVSRPGPLVRIYAFDLEK
ncbi:MAG: glycosyltransferase family 39 protein [Myxococcota bacterium]